MHYLGILLDSQFLLEEQSSVLCASCAYSWIGGPITVYHSHSGLVMSVIKATGWKLGVCESHLRHESSLDDFRLLVTPTLNHLTGLLCRKQ